jgi:hypothetical protein
MTSGFTSAAGFSAARPAHPTWQYLLREFTEALILSPKQLTEIEPILEDAGQRFTQIQLEAMRKARSVMDETIAQIRPLLLEDQQRNLDTWQRIEQALSAAREIKQRTR